MDSELRKRINGIEGIVVSLVTNWEISKFLNFDLHPKAVNIQNNEGLFWIWHQLLGLVVIDLYKLYKDTEKHSIAKLLNIANHKNHRIKQSLIKRADALKTSYSARQYEGIRSKFLAHQDLNVSRMGVDLTELDKLVLETRQWLVDLKKNQKLGCMHNNEEIHSSLVELFKSVDDWDDVQGFLLGKFLLRKKTVRISDIQKLIR